MTFSHSCAVCLLLSPFLTSSPSLLLPPSFSSLGLPKSVLKNVVCPSPFLDGMVLWSRLVIKKIGGELVSLARVVVMGLKMMTSWRIEGGCQT
jgi:hypothetical protein